VAGRHRQRPDRPRLLVGQPDRRPARHQRGHLWNPPKQVGEHATDAIEMLEVVDDQQRRFSA
jgi:hypothetical protein